MPSVLLTILGLLLAAAALLLVLLWAVPVRAGGRWSCSDEKGLSAAVYGGWGALFVSVEFVRERTARVTLFGRTVKELPLPERAEEAAPKTPAGETGAEPEPPAGEEGGFQVDEVTALARQGISLWPQVSPHLLAMLRQVSFGHLTSECRFGLGDAAATGQAFGAFAAIRGVLAVCARIDLKAEPVFTDRLLEGEGEGELVIRHPAALLPPTVRLIMIKDLREMMKQ
ncbi:hypothetical protein AZH53_09135 [Methanomicrobiaceae archaeon CYW5]|uniref:DUF2953 domain-containing protein n=1 Tax=Methanovulcanius yangii TaxID=1789227 RepID=UPI0029CA841A|nr:DUF2953 domain-containing protein [Methanovulcanius yangii]MBT8508567.1 hypothetical protein [Methanovulcanius yangii]